MGKWGLVEGLWQSVCVCVCVCVCVSVIVLFYIFRCLIYAGDQLALVLSSSNTYQSCQFLHSLHSKVPLNNRLRYWMSTSSPHPPFTFFKNLFILFIYVWLRWVFVAVCGLSLVAASGGYSLLWCMGFSLLWLLLSQSMGSRRTGFSSCGTRAQYLWHTGLVAPRHVRSSWTRAQTHVPCIGRRILNHWATREVPPIHFF